jgi:hypothetical protein
VGGEGEGLLLLLLVLLLAGLVVASPSMIVKGGGEESVLCRAGAGLQREIQMAGNCRYVRSFSFLPVVYGVWVRVV